MPHPTYDTSDTSTAPPMTRRRALGALLATTLWLSLPSDDAQANETGDASSIMVGETFVGRTADTNTVIAVVLGEQHTTAYLCDGTQKQDDMWFHGAAIDDQLDLTAANGARLIGQRSLSGIGGWIVFHDGRGISFLAHPVTGVVDL